jgi:predicted CoA-binding protein
MVDQSDACPLPSEDLDARVKEILGTPRTVAVVGMSPKPERPSHDVGLYLKSQGFNIIPVHPKAEEIGGLKVYPHLEAIPKEQKVEIVDLFVSGEATLKAVEQAVRIGAKIIWFQPGTENPEYETRAGELGLEVISGRCTKADHQRFFS